MNEDKYYHGDITSKHTDWGGEASTDNKQVAGDKVQEFIKSMFESKVGCLYYDKTNNRYMAFADEENRDKYLSDPGTYATYLLGTFDAPFNYSAKIMLTSKAYNAILKGATGNYIDFTFDTMNKSGQSAGEAVTATFTFIKNGNKQSVTQKYQYGSAVHFNIDKYISVGTNNITVGITGVNTLAATTVGMVYNVIDLSLTHSYDLSRIYNLNTTTQAAAEIPYTVSGAGTKTMEWYLDGVLQNTVQVEDEITETTSSRTKMIQLSGLAQGAHSIQFRASVTVNGEKFYSDTMYIDVVVVNGSGIAPIVAMATVITTGMNIIQAGGSLLLYGAIQYVPYIINYFVYNPSGSATTNAIIAVDGTALATVSTSNGYSNTYSIRPTSYGPKALTISAGSTVYSASLQIQKSSTTIDEISNGLMLNLSAVGKSNNSTDKDKWTYAAISSTFSGFSWNATSGWTGTALRINSGAKVDIGIAPLSSDLTTSGGTLEIELATDNVSDENAIVCDLRGKNGAGLVITASSAVLTSAAGSKIETKFKSGENRRLTFVINRKLGVANRLLVELFVDGKRTAASNYASTDNFMSTKSLSIGGSSSCDIILKSLRFYSIALGAEQVLNNYILYRDTVDEMLEIYDRNNIYEEGSSDFSVDKLSAQLPVMIFTGSIPTLEETTDKNKTIYVDIQYINYQDPTKSFTIQGAKMKPQGTSSMSYPRKNFRIYSNVGTMYDYQGNVIEGGTYAFKTNAQKVTCWCLKADYAESSSTHNTGIARIWNKVMYNAQLNGEYVLRTQAQKAAFASKYPYDVRTTVDGFPIVCFYKLTSDSDMVFMGKYNFNNDKSTESVFGFKDITGFDNTNMQCWEVLNNGHHLCNFKDVLNFDTEWSDAYEARYPGKSQAVADLKELSTWLASTRHESDVTYSGNISVSGEIKSDSATQYGSSSMYVANGSYIDNAANRQLKFEREKWDYLDVYKVAAYYIYLMRCGGVDQAVKNAMLTSEGTNGAGTHCKWFFINYDNDTIFGLVNDGPNVVPYTADRQSVDPRFTSTTYYYAGHDSTLWNNLEADAEFMRIVSDIDNALYQAGFSYENVIDMFDIQQMGKWCERVYNQDSQYKYIMPYINSGINNLFMCQGSRQSHRRYWLSHRFDLMDSKLVSGAYKSHTFEMKLANAPTGLNFSIVAGSTLYYGYGVNNVVQESGVKLNDGESHTFTTKSILNVGDPLRIYGATNLKEIDVSALMQYMSQMSMNNVYSEAVGTKLKKLVIGNTTDSNTSLAEISGLASATRLEYLDISNMKAITNLDLSKMKYLTTLKAAGSGLSSVLFADGGAVNYIELPDTLHNVTLKNLPSLTTANIKIVNYANINTLVLESLPNVDMYTIASKALAGGSMTHVRMVGFSSTDSTLEKLYKLALLRGFDSIGNATDKAVISGSIHVTYADQLYLEYLNQNMPDVTITYDTYRKTPTITLKAVTSSGTAIQGATFSINGGETILTSGTDGTATYRTAQQFTLATSMNGYQTVTQTVQAYTVDSTVNVSLLYLYDITFQVNSSFGGTLSGCSITIGTETVTTSADGKAVFKRINGTYSYTANYASETSQTGSITVSNANPSQSVLTFDGDIEVLKPTPNGNIQMLVNSQNGITLYIRSTDANAVISWGDGTTSPTVLSGSYVNHIYPLTNTNYQIEVSNCENVYECSTNNGSGSDYRIRAYWTIGNSKVKNLCFNYSPFLYYIGSDLLKNDTERIGFIYCFKYTHITKIPDGLLDCCTNATDLSSMFMNTYITNIPESLLFNCTKVVKVTQMFCGANISTMPEQLFSRCSELTTVDGCFSSCKHLKVVPENLFKFNTRITVFGSGALGIFSDCSALSSIPEGIFRYNTEALYFSGVFSNTRLDVIPPNLFAYNTKAKDFSCAFRYCTITAIPANLFVNNALIETFELTFADCWLRSIPNGLFIKNTTATSFRMTFFNCKFLQNIPSNMFDTNVRATNFAGVFGSDYNKDAASFTSIPEDLFKFNTLATTFSYAFKKSNINTIPDDIFRYNTECTDFSHVFEASKITSIPERLFYYNIKAVNFEAAFYGDPNGDKMKYTSIPDALFVNCHNITNLTNAFSLSNIVSVGRQLLSHIVSTTVSADCIFCKCPNLLYVEIPSNIYKINTQFVSDCNALKYIELFSDTPPAYSENIFGSHIPMIYVPVNSINTYKSASGWKTLSNYITRPNLVMNVILSINFKKEDGTLLETKTYTIASGTPSYYEISSNNVISGYINDTALIDLSTGTTVNYDCLAYPTVSYTVTKHFKDDSGNTIKPDETESFNVGDGICNDITVASGHSSIAYNSKTFYVTKDNQTLTLTANTEVTFTYTTAHISWDGAWSKYDAGTYSDNSYMSNTISDSQSTVETMTCIGIKSVVISCRSYGESGYDFLTIGNIDSQCNRSTYQYSLMNKSSATQYYDYTITFPDTGNHYIQFCYSKDGGGRSGDDNCHVYVKSYSLL